MVPTPTVLVVDAELAGVAGDMFTAALLDCLEIDYPTKISKKLQEIHNGFEIKISNKSYSGISGRYLELSGELEKLEINELINLYSTLCDELEVRGRYRSCGMKALGILKKAEQEIHSTEKVHLHELGTVDTLIDIFTPMYLLQELAIGAVSISPIQTGFGTTHTAHGVLPVPTPATSYILSRASIELVESVRGEMTTPTGAALIYALSTTFERARSYIIEKSGLGFGTKDLEDRGNYLRVRIGKTSKTPKKVSLLETNLDDVPGEVLGYTMDRLLEQGALDVTYYPIQMKKNRPAQKLQVICDQEDVEHLAEVILSETGTLGIRVLETSRHIGRRDTRKIEVFVDELKSKVDFDVKSGPYYRKIEFDDLARLSRLHNIPLLRMRDILSKYIED